MPIVSIVADPPIPGGGGAETKRKISIPDAYTVGEEYHLTVRSLIVDVPAGAFITVLLMATGAFGMLGLKSMPALLPKYQTLAR